MRLENDESIYTALYRYAAVCKICGISIEDENIRRLSKKTILDIRFDEHFPAVDTLIILYGAGFMSEETFCYLVKHYGIDLEEDIKAAEHTVSEQNELPEEDKLSPNQIEKAVLTAANTKIYKGMQHISFAEALKISALPSVNICNGFAYLTDKTMFDFLSENDEPFGFIENSDLYIETKENLKTLDENSEKPFIVNLRNFLSMYGLFKEAYGKEFIMYAKSKNIPLTHEEYEKYIKQIKLKFEIKSYRRKRNVCGDNINWFDYAPSVESSDNLNADYSKEILLDVSDNYNDETLRKKAIDKFRSIYTLDERTIIEVYHCCKRYLYIADSRGINSIDSEDFHRMLFDFNKIWSIIQLCSRNRKIKAVNDGAGNTVISIEDEIWEEIPQEQRPYAEKLVREQYEQQKEKRRTSSFMQKLSSIKAEASSQKNKSDQEKTELAKQRADMLKKRQTREKSTEDTEG